MLFDLLVNRFKSFRSRVTRHDTPPECGLESTLLEACCKCRNARSIFALKKETGWSKESPFQTKGSEASGFRTAWAHYPCIETYFGAICYSRIMQRLKNGRRQGEGGTPASDQTNRQYSAPSNEPRRLKPPPGSTNAGGDTPPHFLSTRLRNFGSAGFARRAKGPRAGLD